MSPITFKTGDAEWTKRRARALGDLYYFASNVLGYANHFPLNPETHLLLCRFLERKTGEPDIDCAPILKIEMPRGTGKTSLGTVARSIQLACANPNTSILIANEKAATCESFLATIKSQFETNDLLRALFPEAIPLDFKQTTWKTDAATLQRTTHRPEPTFFTIGVGGTVTGAHPDHIIADDLISKEAMESARVGAWQIMDRVNRWCNELKLLLNTQAQPFPTIGFIGCVAASQRVLMASGAWRPIQDVRAGERVWSWNESLQRFTAQRVLAVIPQGETKTVRVSSKQHSLVVTPNHPFLRVRRSHNKSNKKDWVRADELRVGQKWHAGDRVGAVRLVPDPPYTRAGFVRGAEFLWLLGFLWGDGWVTKYVGKTTKRGTTYAVCAALGVDEALNARVETALRDSFGGHPYRTPAGYIRMDCAAAGRELEQWGLMSGVGAKDKCLPTWLWEASTTHKRAFLRGLLDADGTETTRGRVPRATLSTSSHALAEETRMLAFTCGVKPTNVYTRTRAIQAPHSRAPILSTEHCVSFSFETGTEQLKAERVSSVEPASESEMVYDLSIEGTENFIAEGFVVHNTRWWQNDTYDYIEHTFGGPEELRRRYRLSAKTPDGQFISREVYRVGQIAVFRAAAIEQGVAAFPEIYSLERLAELRADDPELFSCNMMNEPSNAAVRTFQDPWLRYYDRLDNRLFAYRKDDGTMRYVPDDALRKTMVVDPAFTAHGSGARAGLIVTGTDSELGRHLVLEALAVRAEPRDLVVDVLNTAKQHRVSTIYIESVAQQLAFIQFVQNELRAKNLPIAVEAVRPSGRAKDVRIESLSAYFKAGQILVHRSQLDLLNEYASFRPGARYKDLLDALAYAAEKWPLSGPSTGNAAKRAQQQLDGYLARRGLTPA